MNVRALRALEGHSPGAVASGLLVAALLLGVYVAGVALLGAPGHRWSAAGAPLLHPEHRLNVVVIFLMSFLFASQRYVNQRKDESLEQLRSLTDCGEAEFEELRERHESVDRRRLFLVALGSALLGIGAVPATQRDPLSLLQPGLWGFRLAWSFGANAALFATLGVGIYRSMRSHAALADVVERIERIDLLDRAPLAPFPHMGLRHAFVWLGGSSIASLIVLDVERAWPVAVVILVTLGTGAFAFLGPLRAIRDRLRLEKSAELARVRARIREASSSALASEPGAEGASLPGLLAYEARVAAVSEWPVSAPTLLRLGVLAALAVGSWLGGAVVERLLSVALE